MKKKLEKAIDLILYGNYNISIFEEIGTVTEQIQQDGIYSTAEFAKAAPLFAEYSDWDSCVYIIRQIKSKLINRSAWKNLTYLEAMRLVIAFDIIGDLKNLPNKNSKIIFIKKLYSLVNDKDYNEILKMVSLLDKN